MTVALQVLMCGVLVFGGAGLLYVGWRGLRETLPRNRFAGVRTPATMRHDDAFRVGNRVAAPSVLAGGGVSLLAGLTMLGLPAGSGTGTLISIIGILGMIGLVIAGGVLGNRAAAAVPEPAGCGGCQGGCCGS